MQVLQNSSYRAAAARLSVVLKTQLKRHHPYAAAADEVELAINTRLAQQPSSQRRSRQIPSAGASAGAADNSRMRAADQQQGEQLREASAGQPGLTKTEL